MKYILLIKIEISIVIPNSVSEIGYNILFSDNNIDIQTKVYYEYTVDDWNYSDRPVIWGNNK